MASYNMDFYTFKVFALSKILSNSTNSWHAKTLKLYNLGTCILYCAMHETLSRAAFLSDTFRVLFLALLVSLYLFFQGFFRVPNGL